MTAVAPLPEAASATAALRDRVRDAAGRAATMRIAGAGTWLDAGRPVEAAETVPLTARGILGYVPGDLTLTALAGTTLAEIRAATAQHHQWLALDPFGTDDGTVGATVATGSSGPLATGFGRARDLALGLEFVTGNGDVVRGGGRVVKNVAGFDLTRLLTGSWGTLGVITEVTLRLHARPEAETTIAIRLESGASGGAAAAQAVRQLFRRLPFLPYACEVLNAELAGRLTQTPAVTALIRLGGNREAVRGQREALAALGGDALELASGVWDDLRSAEPREAIVFRLSAPPSQIDGAWREAERLTARIPGVLLHAAPLRGVVRCIIPAGASTADELRVTFAAPATIARIGERLPAELWPLCAPPPLADAISRGIRNVFDPSRLLNPGILGDT